MMKLQFKAFQLSLLIHLLIVSLVVIGGRALGSDIQRLVMVSLDIEHIREETPPAPPKPEPERKIVIRKAVAPVTRVEQLQPEKQIEEITPPRTCADGSGSGGCPRRRNPCRPLFPVRWP